MDYSQLSDFEINKAVAEIVINGDWFLEPSDENPSWFFNLGVEGKNTVKLPDYCNNASDAWPIIQDNFISIIFDEDGNEPTQNAWCKAITKTGESHYGSEKEPLKTAMIAFLMKVNKCTFCDGNGFIQIDHGENIGIEHKACPQCEGKCYVHP